mgnify:CR=1 FL=1
MHHLCFLTVRKTDTLDQWLISKTNLDEGADSRHIVRQQTERMSILSYIKVQLLKENNN